MRHSWLILSCIALSAAEARPEANPTASRTPDPKITSIYPATAQRGTTVEVEVRGRDLTGPISAAWEISGLSASVVSVQPDEDASASGEKAAKKDGVAQVAKLRIALPPDSRSGPHAFRFVTSQGVSNKLFFQVSPDPVISDLLPSSTLRNFPVIVNGRIGHPGDSGSYWIEASAGEKLTFDVTSYSESLDPTLTILERSGSWFDQNRLNPIAFNDEPLSFPGLSKNARLTQQFSHAGRYCVDVRSFGGRGGPDFVYALHITRASTVPAGATHELITGEENSRWQERTFTRELLADRMAELARRGGDGTPAKAIEIYHAAPEGTHPAPVLVPPALIEGRITKPGGAHVIQVKIAKPENLAIEIGTPEATLPRFNPVVRLIDPGGREIAGDVYTKRNNNGLYMMKMIESKTIFSLNAPGDYTLQIRDITTNGAGSDFAYRVLVRPQVPHLGSVHLAADHVNLAVGASQPLDIVIEREEAFKDYLTLRVEGLPKGVAALPALENAIDKPPLPNGGKLERYVPQEQHLSVALVAEPGAPVSEKPVNVRLSVQVLRNGRLQPPIPIGDIPLMVVAPGGKL